MGIDTILSIGVSISLLIGAVWGVLHYIIVSEMQPRKEAEKRFNDILDNLDKTVSKLNDAIDRMATRQYEVERQMAVIEQTLSALHKRMDIAEANTKNFAHFCYETHRNDAGHDCTPVIDIMNQSGCWEHQ